MNGVVTSASTAWIYLIVAGCLEVVWALGIKYTVGFSKPVPSAITIGAMIASVWLLALAIKTIPVGTGYAVWVGIGAVGAAIGGAILFGESRSLPRIICILLIVAGVVGLKLFSDADGA
jgi:quaternary ammonium compound-resistance protein SugE